MLTSDDIEFYHSKTVLELVALLAEKPISDLSDRRRIFLINKAKKILAILHQKGLIKIE